MSYNIISLGVAEEAHAVYDDPSRGYNALVVGEGDTEAEAYEDALEQFTDDAVDELRLPAFWGDDATTVCSNCDRNGGLECFDEACTSKFYVVVYYNE